MTEYRIEFQIQRAADEDGEFEEIGFGSSGAWSDLDQAVYTISSNLQNGIWETQKGQPDPDEVLGEIAAERDQ